MQQKLVHIERMNFLSVDKNHETTELLSPVHLGSLEEIATKPRRLLLLNQKTKISKLIPSYLSQKVTLENLQLEVE